MEPNFQGNPIRLRQIYNLLRPYRLSFLGFSVLSVVAMLAEMAAVVMIFPLIKLIVPDGDMALSNNILDAVTDALKDLGFVNMWSIGILLILIVLIKSLLTFAVRYSGDVFRHRFQKDMQTALANRFVEVNYGYISKQNIGILADLSLRCVGRSAGVFHSGLLALAACIATLIYGVFMLGISWYLTIGVVFAGIVISFVNGWAVRSARRSGVQAAEEESVVGGLIHALLSGARIIRSYGQEENEKRKFKSLQEGIYKRRKRKSVAQNITGPTSETASILAIVIVLIIGSELFGQTSLATMAVFAAVLLRVLPKVAGFNRSRALIASEFTYVEQVVGWLEETRYLKQPNGTHVFDTLGDQIQFKRVNFKYNSRNEFALNDIDLKIPKGKVTAIVGPSGGGKSTLLDLILRFYDPTSGNIEIDGRDLRELDVHSWRSRIGVVSQEGFLFNDSLGANIG